MSAAHSTVYLTGLRGPPAPAHVSKLRTSLIAWSETPNRAAKSRISSPAAYASLICRATSAVSRAPLFGFFDKAILDHPTLKSTASIRKRKAMDKLSTERRSENMRRIKSKGMKPEMRVRSTVHELGFRFRLHRRDLPG